MALALRAAVLMVWWLGIGPCAAADLLPEPDADNPSFTLFSDDAHDVATSTTPGSC